jgi:hypothetical protein
MAVTLRDLGSIAEGNLDTVVYVRVGNALLSVSSAELEDDDQSLIIWAEL